MDIARVSGTGPGGRITKEDVLKYIEEGEPTAASAATEAPAGGGEETIPLSTMREVIARRMIDSFQTPHFYLTVEVDAQELQRTRQQLLPVIENRRHSSNSVHAKLYGLNS